MLSRSIALSEQLAAVSLEAECVFYRMIPHADREGRLPGSVIKLHGLIAPLQVRITPDLIRSALIELRAVELIHWYTSRGAEGDVEVIELPGFKRHQRGARFDREAASKLPAPDEVRSGPDLVRVSEVKLKVSEVKLSEGKSDQPPPSSSQLNGNSAPTVGLVGEAPAPRRPSRPVEPWQAEKDQQRADQHEVAAIKAIVAQHGPVPQQFPTDKWQLFSQSQRAVISRFGGLLAVWESES